MRRLDTFSIKLPLFLRVIALYIFAGGLITSTITLQPAASTAVASYVPPKPQLSLKSTDTRVGEPTRIRVPRLSIDLDIIDGTYHSSQDSWTLTDDKAQFARMTALPNNKSGNTFIYGHNTTAVFARLARLGAGDIVQIHTTNKLTFQYRYSGKQIVNPTTTSILDSSELPKLTLMTCDGIFSQSRRVMIFDFERIV